MIKSIVLFTLILISLLLLTIIIDKRSRLYMCNNNQNYKCKVMSCRNGDLGAQNMYPSGDVSFCIDNPTNIACICNDIIDCDYQWGNW